MNGSYKYLTLGLLTGFVSGTVIGVLLWPFTSIFSISICASIGMLAGIAVGTWMDHRKSDL